MKNRPPTKSGWYWARCMKHLPDSVHFLAGYVGYDNLPPPKLGEWELVNVFQKDGQLWVACTGNDKAFLMGNDKVVWGPKVKIPTAVLKATDETVKGDRP